MAVTTENLTKHAQYLLNPPPPLDPFWVDKMSNVLEFVDHFAENAPTMPQILTKEGMRAVIDKIPEFTFGLTDSPDHTIGIVEAILTSESLLFEEQSSMIVILLLVQPKTMFFEVKHGKETFQMSIFDQPYHDQFFKPHLKDMDMRAVARLLTTSHEDVIESMVEHFSVNSKILNAFDRWFIDRMENPQTEDFKSIGTKILAARISYGRYEQDAVLIWLSTRPNKYEELMKWIDENIYVTSTNYSSYRKDFLHFLIWKLLYISNDELFIKTSQWINQHHDYEKIFWEWCSKEFVDVLVEAIRMRYARLNLKSSDPLFSVKLFWILMHSKKKEEYEPQVIHKLRGQDGGAHARALVELAHYDLSGLVALIRKSSQDRYLVLPKSTNEYLVELAVASWNQSTAFLKMELLKCIDNDLLKKRPKHAGSLQKLYDLYLSSENKDFNHHCLEKMLDYLDIFLEFPVLMPSVFTVSSHVPVLNVRDKEVKQKLVKLFSHEQFPAESMFVILAANKAIANEVLKDPAIKRKYLDVEVRNKYAEALIHILTKVASKPHASLAIHSKQVGYAVQMIASRYPQPAPTPYSTFTKDLYAMASTYQLAYPKTLKVKSAVPNGKRIQFQYSSIPYTPEEIQSQALAREQLFQEVKQLEKALHIKPT